VNSLSLGACGSMKIIVFSGRHFPWTFWSLRHEARRIAANIAKLPESLGKPLGAFGEARQAARRGLHGLCCSRAFQRVNVHLANFDAATEKARYLFGACESR
jgi:hypothetical protein